jgi:diguanylate cyclase (GGDEF)-like protein
VSEDEQQINEDGPRFDAGLKAQVARVQQSREQIAKAWLVDVILIAVGRGPEPRLEAKQLERARGLAALRGSNAPPGQLTREISSLHLTLLSSLRAELPSNQPGLLTEAAERLAAVFGEVTGAAVQALVERSDSGRDALTGLHGPAQMNERLRQMIAGAKRYEHPFALVLLGVEGPGTQDKSEGPGQEGVLAIVSAALRGSIRLVDEPFRLENDSLCVLAPNQTAADGTQMAQRLAAGLAKLQESGGLQISVAAGVVSCPEHGEDAEQLLRQADTAMWRARATGQAVTVGAMQDH